MQTQRTRLVITSAALLAIAGCGGSSSPSTTLSAPVAAPAAVTLTGTAASGAAFAGAIVKVRDNSGNVVGTSTPVAADGSFTITLAAGAKAPFVIDASRTNSTDGVEVLISVVASAESTQINVTPVTTLVAARLSTSGDPSKLAGELASGSANIDAARLAAKVDEVKQILAPVLLATGTRDFDPMKGSFTTDGTGYDRLLDSITVSVTPSSAQTANVEIGIKQTQADPQAQPPVIHFDNTQSIAAITSNAANSAVLARTIDPTRLVESGTTALINDLMRRMTACYALPLASRVTAGARLAADITAPECKTIFAEDQPALYKSSGASVGKGQAFNGIFVDAATGVVFDQGSYEYTRDNGSLVISYRSVAANGSEAYDTLVVRKEADKLKLIGNQYAYQGGVFARHQLRQYVTLAQTAYANYSTGYTLNINNQLDANGAPLFDRVEVTAPDQSVFVLKPTPGNESLYLVKNGVTTSTPFIRLRAEYADAGTAGTPADVETSLVYASPALSEDAVAAIPAQSVWAFKYYLKSDPTQVASTQYYRTRARALTIAEFRTRGLPSLTADTVQQMQAIATPTGQVPLSGVAPLLGWEVPANALPPTQLVYDGSKVDPMSGAFQLRFTDTTAVAAADRSGRVSCSVASSGDTHCEGAGPAYASGNLLTGVQMLSKDSKGRDFGNVYATYALRR